MSIVTETAEVVAVEGTHAWVETRRKAVCDGCSVQKGCGSGIISRLFNKRARLRVANTLDARVGDRVVLGMDDGTLVRNSFAVYMMPLVWMLLGALGGQTLGTALQWAYVDGVTALFGVLGLAAGFLWLRRYARGIAADGSRQPGLLRFADPEDCGGDIILQQHPAARRQADRDGSSPSSGL